MLLMVDNSFPGSTTAVRNCSVYRLLVTAALFIPERLQEKKQQQKSKPVSKMKLKVGAL